MTAMTPQAATRRERLAAAVHRLRERVTHARSTTPPQRGIPVRTDDVALVLDELDHPTGRPVPADLDLDAEPTTRSTA